MAVTVVRGVVASSHRSDSEPLQVTNPQATNVNPTSLAQLVTRGGATDATIVRVRAATKSADGEKLREFHEANSKANELSERIRDDEKAEDAHTAFDPVSASRSLSTNS